MIDTKFIEATYEAIQAARLDGRRGSHFEVDPRHLEWLRLQARNDRSGAAVEVPGDRCAIWGLELRPGVGLGDGDFRLITTRD